MILPTPVNDAKPLFSFTEWQEKGFVVMKGEKTKGRTPTGFAGFTEEQVKPHAVRNAEYSAQYYVPPERTRPVPIINPANAIGLGSGIRFVNGDIERLQRQAHNPIVNTDVEDAAMMAYFNQMLLSRESPPVKIAKKAKMKKEEPEEQVLSNKRKIDI